MKKNNRQTKKLGEIFNIKSSKRVHKADWQKSGIPFYRAREVVKLAMNGHVDDELFISPELYEKFTVTNGAPKKDDIIISAVGTLGQCYLVKETDKFYFKDASVLWFEKKERDTDSRYIEYAFKSDLIFDQVMHKSMGATVGTLTIQRAKSIRIPLPPLPEQLRIVKILDDTFEKIDQAKRNTEKNLQNAKALFESYLQIVFTKSSEDWDEHILDNVSEVEYGYTTKAKSEGDFRFIRITDTDENGLVTKENKMYVNSFRDVRKYILNSGDLLMARTGASAGNVLLFESEEKAIFASYLIRIKFKKGILSKLYWYFSKSNLYWDQVRRLSAGSAQPQFNGGAVKQIIFPFPKSLSKQKSIVKKLDQLSAQNKKLEEIYQKKLKYLEELKKSILQRAFNGDL